MKKLLFSLLTLALVIGLAACGGEKKDEKSITLGATAGPYSDMLNKAIKPLLEDKGYKVEIKEFSDYIQPNIALNEGSLDANLFQHTIYLENFEQENDMDLTALIIVPTAPMGVYSEKYQSLDEIEDGATVAIPNDPSNAARALLMLQENGLIKVDPNVEDLKASEKDIKENEKNLDFKPLEAGSLPRAVESVDLVTVPGNFALAAKMDLLDAIVLENMPDEYRNVVAIKADNEDSQLSRQ